MFVWNCVFGMNICGVYENYFYTCQKYWLVCVFPSHQFYEFIFVFTHQSVLAKSIHKVWTSGSHQSLCFFFFCNEWIEVCRNTLSSWIYCSMHVTYADEMNRQRYHRGCSWMWMSNEAEADIITIIKIGIIWYLTSSHKIF